MKETETKQWWKCKGRSDTGCGWVYESPIFIEQVGHRCPAKDREFRRLTLIREVKK